jgi:transcriptional regulator with XRE-family HTH domain
MENISLRLKGFREHLGYSQKDFSDILSIERVAYNKIENGTKKPGNDIYTPLYEKFNLNLNWLITGEGEMFLPNSKNKSSMGENEVEILSLYRNNKQFRELMDNMIDVYKGGYDIIKAFNQMLKTLLPSDKK